MRSFDLFLWCVAVFVVGGIIWGFVWMVRVMRQSSGEVAEMEDGSAEVVEFAVPAGHVDVALLQRAAPMPAIRPRKPHPSEEPVMVFESESSEEVEGLAEQLRLRGIACEVTQRLSRAREGKVINEYSYAQAVVWSRDERSAREIINSARYMPGPSEGVLDYERRGS